MAKKIYFQCLSGAAGDMLLGSILDIIEQIEGSRERFLPLVEALLAETEGASWRAEEVQRNGLRGLKVDFFVGQQHADHFAWRRERANLSQAQNHHHHHHHHHHGQHDHCHEHCHDQPQESAHGTLYLELIERIQRLQARGVLDKKSSALAEKIFRILAEAEAKVHGTEVEQVHFHEVGSLDAFLDVVCFASFWTALEVEETHCSPLTTGSGVVHTAHGVLGVPAPAVLEILRAYAIPTSDIVLPGECLTPTGAACLAAVVSHWGPLPNFARVIAQGAGAGTREITGIANMVRAVIGD